MMLRFSYWSVDVADRGPHEVAAPEAAVAARTHGGVRVARNRREARHEGAELRLGVGAAAVREGLAAVEISAVVRVVPRTQARSQHQQVPGGDRHLAREDLAREGMGPAAGRRAAAGVGNAAHRAVDEGAVAVHRHVDDVRIDTVESRCQGGGRIGADRERDPERGQEGHRVVVGARKHDQLLLAVAVDVRPARAGGARLELAELRVGRVHGAAHSIGVEGGVHGAGLRQAGVGRIPVGIELGAFEPGERLEQHARLCVREVEASGVEAAIAVRIGDAVTVREIERAAAPEGLLRLRRVAVETLLLQPNRNRAVARLGHRISPRGVVNERDQG